MRLLHCPLMQNLILCMSSPKYLIWEKEKNWNPMKTQHHIMTMILICLTWNQVITSAIMSCILLIQFGIGSMVSWSGPFDLGVQFCCFHVIIYKLLDKKDAMKLIVHHFKMMMPMVVHLCLLPLFFLLFLDIKEMGIFSFVLDMEIMLLLAVCTFIPCVF